MDTTIRLPYIPLPGHAFVAPHGVYNANVGPIFIPIIARRIKANFGKVLRVAPYPSGACRVWRNGKRVTVEDGTTLNRELENLQDKSVLFQHGRLFEADEGRAVMVVRLEDIIAILPDDASDTVRVLSHNNDIPRCPWCKSEKGQGNMLLDGHGYCIQCQRNAAGELAKDRQLPKPTEEWKAAVEQSKRAARVKVSNLEE